MATIYDFDFKTFATNMLPNLKRTARGIGWLSALFKPLQWLRDNFFNEYVNGSAASLYNGATAYVAGDRVVDLIDNGVYESQTAQTGVIPSTANNPAKWQKVSDNWVGVSERTKYTGQKIALEYALNKWFRSFWLQPNNDTTPTRPAIYIDNNNINNLAFISYANSESSSDAFSADVFQQNFITDVYSFGGAWFTIWTPLALYTALQPSADSKIRAIADKYVIAGITYDIKTY